MPTPTDQYPASRINTLLIRRKMALKATLQTSLWDNIEIAYIHPLFLSLVFSYLYCSVFSLIFPSLFLNFPTDNITTGLVFQLWLFNSVQFLFIFIFYHLPFIISPSFLEAS